MAMGALMPATVGAAAAADVVVVKTAPVFSNWFNTSFSVSLSECRCCLFVIVA